MKLKLKVLSSCERAVLKLRDDWWKKIHTSLCSKKRITEIVRLGNKTWQECLKNVLFENSGLKLLTNERKLFFRFFKDPRTENKTIRM